MYDHRPIELFCTVQTCHDLLEHMRADIVNIPKKYTVTVIFGTP